MGVKVREKPKRSGNWWIFVTHNGKRKSKRIGKDKRLANEIAKKIEARLILGDLELNDGKKPIPGFKEIAEQWLEVQVKPTKRKTTHLRYSSLYRMYLKKPLGPIPIDEIKRKDVIKALRLMQAKGLSRSSIEGAKNVISGVSEFAIDYEYLSENPCSGVLKRLGLSRKKDRKPITIFTREEASVVLETFNRYRPDYYPLILTAFRTAMRLGEILALQWDNVNWRDRYILVENSYRNGQLTKTKTGRARRVDLSDQLFDTLRGLLKTRKKQALKSGDGTIQPIIFHTKGDYTSQNTVRNIWKRLLAKAGIDYRKFHTIRHTVASLLLSSGKSPVYVKEQLGHSSIVSGAVRMIIKRRLKNVAFQGLQK